MPEYVSKRFQSKSIRTVITIVALISCVFTKTSVSYIVCNDDDDDGDDGDGDDDEDDYDDDDEDILLDDIFIVSGKVRVQLRKARNLKSPGPDRLSFPVAQEFHFMCI